jgi:hypothetical protein
MDHAVVNRGRFLDTDPGFQAYADLWRELEYARSTFDARNIPRVIGTQSGTNVTPPPQLWGIPWIQRRLGEIPIELQHLKSTYKRLENLNITGTNAEAVLQNHEGVLTYNDVNRLKEMRKEASQLRILETRYMDEWDKVRDLMESVATNEYARRMDPNSELRYYYDDPMHGEVQLTGSYIEGMDQSRVTHRMWYPEVEDGTNKLTIGDRRRMQTLQSFLL